MGWLKEIDSGAFGEAVSVQTKPEGIQLHHQRTFFCNTAPLTDEMN